MEKQHQLTADLWIARQPKKHLAFWVGLLKQAPPESKQSTWTEVGTTFAAGRAAQGLGIWRKRSLDCN